jgi:hypothetical protein
MPTKPTRKPASSPRNPKHKLPHELQAPAAAAPERLPKIVASPQLPPPNRLDGVLTRSTRTGAGIAPYYENRLDLPAYLETIAAEMRAGNWSPVSEACLLFKDMENHDPAVITVLRWGENDGLMDRETVAALGGRVGMVQ